MENIDNNLQRYNWNVHFSKQKFLWVIVFLVYVNPAYLDRFSVFGYFTTAVKLLIFGYFVLFRVLRDKIPRRIIPWIGYAIIPMVVTIAKRGNITSALVYSFTVISAAFMFFYTKERYVKDMIEGLALVMELLTVINLITIILVPNGLYRYETEAGWWSSDVWFFGLRNSHSPFLCLTCFASTIDYFINEGLGKKLIAIIMHVIAVVTIVLLSSGGGMVSFAVYFFILLLLFRKNRTNINPFVLKIRLVVVINIGIFAFLSFFIANTNVVNIFGIIGAQRVYTMGRRVTIWAAVWEKINQAPIWGHGFMYAYDLRWLSTLAAGSISSHNSMMDICFRGGIVTLIVYCVMLISAGKYVDDSKHINYRIKNIIAASWFTVLLLLQTEGAMMSIPLLTIVGMTYRIGQALQADSL